MVSFPSVYKFIQTPSYYHPSCRLPPSLLSSISIPTKPGNDIATDTRELSPKTTPLDPFSFLYEEGMLEGGGVELLRDWRKDREGKRMKRIK